MDTTQYQLVTRPRHHRFVFFIDTALPYEKLVSLMHLNQRFWGGRYNPIIPVHNNTITDEYKALANFYDPDYVFYTNNIDIDLIKQLQYFTPSAYVNIQDQPLKEDVIGVDALYFLSQFDKSSKFIVPGNIGKIQSPLIEFYKLNFGLQRNATVSDYELSKDFDRTIIDSTNFSELNKLLYENKPINQAHLSRRNLNTKILRSKLYLGGYNSFELVLASDKSSILDLIYFWNRQLYQCKNIVYLTVEELSILSQDKYFGAVLHDLSEENTIYVVSQSLTKESVEEIIKQQLQPISSHRRFEHREVSSFPLEILDGNGLYERNYGEIQATQVLVYPKGIFQIPKLTFADTIGFYPQQWVVDIDIRTTNSDTLNSFAKLWPIRANSQLFFPETKGRINKKHHISIYIHNQLNTSSTLVVNIPSFKNLMRQITHRPKIDGESVETKYFELGLHDSSYKLLSFFKLFKDDFNTIDDFFTDEFWVETFEYLSTNNRLAGESISLQELKERCIVYLTKNGITLGAKSVTNNNEENLILGLKNTIKELCDYRVFIKGHKLKCSNCSSIFWYPLDDIHDTILCQGCLENFVLPIEPPFSYRLNDLVKNNMFQSKTQRDGNLTVIRTLIRIQKASAWCFDYTPQLNLFLYENTGKPDAELDIVCTADGKIIIGEAKHDSSAFFIDKMKSLKSLVEVAKLIRPDKIVLSCYVDTNNKLNNAKQSVSYFLHDWPYAPKIETFILRSPDNFQLGGHRYFYY